jgi:hypothetical protein
MLEPVLLPIGELLDEGDIVTSETKAQDHRQPIIDDYEVE